LKSDRKSAFYLIAKGWNADDTDATDFSTRHILPQPEGRGNTWWVIIRDNP